MGDSVANLHPKVMILDDTTEVASFLVDAAAGRIPAGTWCAVRDSSTLYFVSPGTAVTGPVVNVISGGTEFGISGADLSAQQYHFVKLDATGRYVLAGVGEPADGILQNVPLAAVGSPVIVMTEGESRIVLTTGAVLDYITSTATGTGKIAVRTTVAGADVTGSYARAQVTQLAPDMCRLREFGLLPTTFS